MIEGDVVINPSQKDWDCIKGYTSNVKCPICTMDILVKTAAIPTPTFAVIWALCQVCFDGGWQIPKVSPDKKQLIYSNSKTRAIVKINIFN